MTYRCEPPERWRNWREHWVVWEQSGRKFDPELMIWEDGEWEDISKEFNHDLNCGYRYLGPALPPTEITRRLREPGLFNIHDLAVVFEEACKGDELSANPFKWPDTRGVQAVVAAVLDAIERELGGVAP